MVMTVVDLKSTWEERNNLVRKQLTNLKDLNNTKYGCSISIQNKFAPFNNVENPDFVEISKTVVKLWEKLHLK